jgi:predicted RecB family nuclease
MSNPITTEAVIAVHQCKRKAFFLLRDDANCSAHDYEKLLVMRASANRRTHLADCSNKVAPLDDEENMSSDGSLADEDLIARWDALCRPKQRTPKRLTPHEPVIAFGTYVITTEEKLALAFAGHVIGERYHQRPTHGVAIPYEGGPRRVRLNTLYPLVEASIDWLRAQRSPSVSAPPLHLNQYCVTCPFRQRCLAKAEDTDDVSLLERMTPKLKKKYGKRGIFTVNQLSFVYRPRRRRKGANAPAPTFNVELQALALRERKIYVEQPPIIPDHAVEMYLDIEGVPDRGFDYLIGVHVKINDAVVRHSFWADTPEDECDVFQDFVHVADTFGDAPIFHYGSYESKSLRRISKRYGLDLARIEERLVNLNEFIFGKVYFPSRSNSLKSLGSLIGSTWDSPDASGLQSLVWRHRWEDSTCDDDLKQKLIRYNHSDCEAVRLLTSELRAIGKFAESRSDVDFAGSPKQHATSRGVQVHRSFERILQSAHMEFRRQRTRIGRGKDLPNSTGGKVGAPKGHPAYIRVAPKHAGKVVRVRRRLKCPKQWHKREALEPTNASAEHTVIDLAFAKSGCRKTITKYVGIKSRCARCRMDYNPPAISIFGGQFFGHAFQSWAVYQRVSLRLPYRAITKTIEDLFSERLSEAAIVNFVVRLARFYAPTERKLLEKILSGPFVHADETKISIRGTQNYVWVLTNGQHVVFRLTETRETTLIQEMIGNYEGIFVSDFYGGYDAFKCRQQKCLAHLIRDLNDDLWKNPFNGDVETFALKVNNLLLPIFDDIERYGLKTRNLRKHVRRVQLFYERDIDGASSACEVVARYQKRFFRYRESLFTFLEHDGIPWNNNAAERAIRHLAVQRKISGQFYWRIAVEYLRLLGIAQTCRFQSKSFLRFLVSGKRDVDQFRDRTRRRSSQQVANQSNVAESNADLD